MRAFLRTAAAALLAAPLAAAAATITIVNDNLPGVGFNDPTPAAPVGGNPGATLGEQRLAAFRYAAALWGARLDSRVEVQILASFVPLACTASTATLGSAGALQAFADFPGAELPAAFYQVALANKLAGVDLAPPGSPDGPAEDLRARFNSRIGEAGCLTGTTWYLGLDLGHSPSQINLVTVLLHEFAHGLGFASFYSVTNGLLLGDPDLTASYTDVYSRYYLDLDRPVPRAAMTSAERVASAINGGRVVWTGPRVTAAVPAVLAPGTPLLLVSTSSAAGRYAVGSASFGPPLSSPGVTGSVVAARDAADAAGPTAADACSPLANAAEVAGAIALVDRGTCGFVVKVKNAQNAGAIAVIVADNAAGSPPAGLGGADPTIVIPAVRITRDDGARIRAALADPGGVTATLGVDLAVRAGADPAGRALLNAPTPVQSGSSISHWDPIAFPNQLMEPSINSDLTFELVPPADLTRAQLRDIGWYPDADLDLVADDGADACLGSDLAATVVIGGTDSGVRNTLLSNGCTVKDLVSRCAAGAATHGAFASCVASLGNALRDAGVLGAAEKGKLQSAAARAAIP